MVTTDEMVWHNDGHIMHLQLAKENLVITHITCPKTGTCDHQVGCLVDWFLKRFGLDCHVGICAPEENLQIAWTLVGDPTDLDQCQIWVISTTDEAFAAWLVTQI